MTVRRFTLSVFGIVGIVIGVLLWRSRTSTDATRTPTAADGTPASDPALLPSGGSADPTGRRGAISGRVTDPGGQPIARAEVCAFASSSKLASASTKTPFCTTSGTDGRYRLGELFAAKFTVSAVAAKFQPSRWRDHKSDTSSLDLKVGETRSGVDIVLDRGGVEVRGRVKDIAGGAIVGALVTVSSGPEGNPLGTTVTHSNAAGEFVVWSTAGSVTAHAIADGYTEGSKNGIAPGQLLEILLTPESVLQGRVVEAGSETPIAGARVTPGAMSQAFWYAGPDHSALTDAEGRFRIAGLEPGRYKPEATSPLRWGAARESTLLGLAETSSEVIIEMHATLAVSGRIVLPNGKGCTDGNVTLIEKTNKERRSEKTDENGSARVDGVFPGTYDVEIACHNAAREDKYEPVTVKDKAVTGLSWKVSTGYAISGVVVDSAGQPVARATVQTRTSQKGDPRARMEWNQAETDADGSFRVRGLPPAVYNLDVQREGLTPLKDPLEVKVEHDVDGLRVVLPAGGTIDGIVTDEGGAGVGGLDVRARGDRYDWTKTTSRDDGRFTFKGKNPGDYHVVAEQNWSSIRAPGTKDDDIQGTLVTVKPGETTQVKLTVESRRGEIRGRVVGEAGEPVPDAFVNAERESESASAVDGEARRNMEWQWGAQHSPVLTDTDGDFTLPKLSPGSYTVRAFRKGGGESTLEKVRVGSRVTLTIKTEGSIAGTLVDPKGKGAERFTVGVHDEKTGLSRRESFFRTDGAWTLRHLPEGTFHLSAEAPEGRALTLVKLAQGEKRDNVRLSIEPNGTLRGRVISLETGEPIGGMLVHAHPAKGEGMNVIMMSGDVDRRNLTDADGRFELERVSAGAVELNVMPKDFVESDYAPAWLPAKAVAGAVTDLPPIRIARARVKGELTGDLGFETKDSDPSVDLEQATNAVAFVRPNSQAAKAGLTPGDEIVSIDGYDVVGPSAYLFYGLSRVAEGTTVTLGLRRGASIILRAGKLH